MAVIEPDRPLAKADVMADLRRSLVAYAIPTRFYKCSDWPKTAAGKLDLMALKARLLRGDMEVLA